MAHKSYKNEMELFVYFAENFPYNFIEKAFASKPELIDHLNGKFQGYYEDYGKDGCMVVFYCYLDSGNRQLLEDYIRNNEW